jgi:hypothetical protein
LSILLLRPWATFKSNEIKELVVVTFVMVAWIAVGSVAGGALGRRIAGAR